MVSIDASARRAYHYVKERRQARPTIRVTDHSPVPTVYYFAWDYDVPSGGMRTIYRHVDILNSAGVPAAVMHGRRGFRCTWFPHQTRTTDVRSAPLGPEDLLVVPETDVAPLRRQGGGIRHVVFNQSGHLTWEKDPAGVTGHYKHSPDLVGVMVVSEHSAELLEYAFGRPVHRVHLGIDPDLFYPPDAPNGRVISYMPRRGRSDAENVLHILRARGALAGWTVDAVDGISQDEVARRLRRSTIFLSTAYQEGFGLPAAEAMASGNYVVGFHGFGGREFFSTDFSQPVPTGDLLAMVTAVEECLVRESTEPGWCWSRGLRAAKHVLSEHSPERERASLLTFFHSVGFAG
jgi:glycosyltransferase involved in cell wall biosynthesis